MGLCTLIRVGLMSLLLVLPALQGHAAATSAETRAQTSRDANGNIQFQFDDTPSIKVAPLGELAAELCPAVNGVSNEGAIRYNKTNKVIEYCDGARWTSLKNTVSCPAGQLNTTLADGTPACLDPTCPKGQMLSKDAAGNFQCSNIYANMSCEVRESFIPTGHLAVIKCLDEEYVLSGTCERYSPVAKTLPDSENWRNGLFTGFKVSDDRKQLSCVFENGNITGGASPWPNWGLRVRAVCCK